MNIFKKKFIIFLLLILFCFSRLFSYVKTNDLTEKKINSNIYRSIIYPGLGQYYMGNRTTGVIFMTLTSFTILGAIYSYNDANNKYNNYKNLGYHNENTYRDYSDKINQMYVFICLGVLIWGVNIYDIYKNKKVFQKKNDGVSFSIENNKAMISYSKIY